MKKEKNMLQKYYREKNKREKDQSEYGKRRK